ncbi:MAG: endo-1,4-beta-xylanase [Dictyoglomus sp.]|nr:endo-1,4-beta-xylanase [Dictyoglomus sp.]MCX7942087.1 endo-1,4-beta-xylanase [Dictyoglomaceae bacterium]MDW8187934.1 endo-1,4-beta-xylanase [Dictyoglomus sp.]
MNKEIPALKEVYKNYFPIGAAVNPTTINTHKALLEKHFNSITPENQMKWEIIHPSPDVYNFSEADKIVEFALKNNMKIRGHTLLWHQQVPSWVFRDDKGNLVSKEVLLKRLEEHIKRVVGYYKGKVYAWDVVNEAISDNPSEFLRDAPWYKIGGEEIIEKAFIWAHEADPNALLFYNDYNLEEPRKRDKAYELVKRLKEKKIPIHGVGIQGHWTLSWPTPSMLEESIKKFQSLGVQVQITEFDISIYYDRNENANFTDPPLDRIERQAEIYKKAFEVLRRYKNVITGVTFWGVADDATWLDYWPVRGRKDHPLLFDVKHSPKKAFWEVINL